ncbi:MAG: prephenate dehydrogenase [Candidatus Omnitrophica bacterium]|nr:prephenate dehydrogenase [Candidatus Omnitrophota bacterium]
MVTNKMAKYNRVTIIGVGLIGGSIGLALKKRHLAKEVIGVFRRASTLKRALKRKTIDKGTLSVAEGVKAADIIVIATPVSFIPKMAAEAAGHAKKGAIITDAGSTKKWIVAKTEKATAKRKTLFVGAHPMAGSEHAGVEFATAGLLEGSPCIVTKTGRTDKLALNKIINFWQALGAKVSVMSPAAHDRSIALISHLPHLAAFSLAAAVPVKDIAYAAEGFKDTTRVASSDPELWADIFLSNKKEVLRSGRMFEKRLRELSIALARGNRSQVVKFLGSAKSKRDKFTQPLL